VDAGTVFRISADGTAFKQLHYFTGTAGAYPRAGLLKVGPMLYGTTEMGGNDGSGTVFKIAAANGAFVKIAELTQSTGKDPWSGLTLGSDNALYGTTWTGGPNGLGVVFRISTDTDMDGIADPADNCLLVANALQEDTNGNGVGDACDVGMPTTPGIAALKSPVAGSTLPAGAVTFGWTAGVGVVQYRLEIGTSLGTRNLYQKALGSLRTATVSGLPHDGRKLYVRLKSWKQGRWLWNDYVYRAPGP